MPRRIRSPPRPRGVTDTCYYLRTRTQRRLAGRSTSKRRNRSSPTKLTTGYRRAIHANCACREPMGNPGGQYGSGRAILVGVGKAGVARPHRQSRDKASGAKESPARSLDLPVMATRGAAGSAGRVRKASARQLRPTSSAASSSPDPDGETCCGTRPSSADLAKGLPPEDAAAQMRRGTLSAPRRAADSAASKRRLRPLRVSPDEAEWRASSNRRDGNVPRSRSYRRCSNRSGL